MAGPQVNAAATKKLAERPLGNQFMLDIPGFEKSLWKTVSGIEATLEIVDTKDRTSNGKPYIKRYPGQLSYTDMSLTNGLAGKEMYDWFDEFVLKGKSDSTKRKEGSLVVLSNDLGKELARWNLTGLWPVSISINELTAQSSALLVETVTLAYERLDRIK